MNTILFVKILIYTIAVFASGCFSVWYSVKASRKTFMTDIEDIMRGYYPVARRIEEEILGPDESPTAPPKRPPARGPITKPPLPNNKTWLDS